MPEHDDLDQALQAALRSYGDPGKDAGFNERILARVTTWKKAATRRRRWALGMLLPAAASLLLVVHSGPRHTLLPKQPPPEITHAQEANAIAATDTRSEKSMSRMAQARQVRAVRPRRAARSVAAQPKLDVFPAPQPLTPAEQALVAFATQAPETERKALLEMQKQMSEPIRISAIHIPPLEPPAPGAN